MENAHADMREQLEKAKVDLKNHLKIEYPHLNYSNMVVDRRKETCMVYDNKGKQVNLFANVMAMARVRVEKERELDRLNKLKSLTRTKKVEKQPRWKSQLNDIASNPRLAHSDDPGSASTASTKKSKGMFDISWQPRGPEGICTKEPIGSSTVMEIYPSSISATCVEPVRNPFSL